MAATDVQNMDRLAEMIELGRHEQEYPPREPFLGRIVKMENETYTFDDGTTSERIVVTIEPLDIAVQTQDGLLRARWRLPKRVTANSIYRHEIKALDGAMRALGFASWVPSEAIGQVMVWAEKDKKTLGLGSMAPERHPLFPVGPPPEGWEKSIPADIAQKKAEAMQAAAERAQSQDAGRPSRNGTSESSIPVTDIRATPQDQAIEIEAGLEEALIEFFDGRELSTAAFMEMPAGLKSEVKAVPGLWQAVLDHRVVGQLIAEGKLDKDGRTLARRGP